MQGRPWASLMPIESTCDGHTDRCTQWLKSPYPRRAMLPRATLSLHPLRGIHDKQACPAAWLPLACCPAFMYPSSKLRQIWDEEKVRVGRLTKLERKLRRENNRVRVRGWKQTNKHSCSLGLQHSQNNGLEINGLVIHTWSDAALAVATRESEHN